MWLYLGRRRGPSGPWGSSHRVCWSAGGSPRGGPPPAPGMSWSWSPPRWWRSGPSSPVSAQDCSFSLSPPVDLIKCRNIIWSESRCGIYPRCTGPPPRRSLRSKSPRTARPRPRPRPPGSSRSRRPRSGRHSSLQHRFRYYQLSRYLPAVELMVVVDLLVVLVVVVSTVSI